MAEERSPMSSVVASVAQGSISKTLFSETWISADNLISFREAKTEFEI